MIMLWCMLQHFLNCSCVDTTVHPRILLHSPLRPGMAHEGKCGSDCQLLALFLPVFALCIFSTFCASMPALSATLRYVCSQYAYNHTKDTYSHTQVYSQYTCSHTQVYSQYTCSHTQVCSQYTYSHTQVCSQYACSHIVYLQSHSGM